MKASNKKRGFVGALALAGVFAIGGYALTNTIAFEDADVTASSGGNNVQVLSVTDVDFTADGGGNRLLFDGATFVLASPISVYNQADTTVYVKYGPTDSWHACVAPINLNTTIVCNTPDEPFSDVGDQTTGELQLVVSE